jgi:quinol monooxygenase YgiN
MSEHIVLYVRFRVRPGRMEDFRSHLYKTIEDMKGEPAHVNTIVHVNLDQPNEVLLYEIWHGTRESWLREEMPRDYRDSYEAGLDDLIEERTAEWLIPLQEWGSSLLRRPRGAHAE